MLKPIIALMAISLSTYAVAESTLPKPEFIGQIVVPSALSLNGTTFGGISDLDYDAKNDVYIALSDDRAQNGYARYYELKIEPKANHITLDILSTHELTDVDGSHFAAKDIDPEGIVLLGEQIVWTSERDKDGKPEWFLANRDGKAQKAIKLPDYYLPNADKTSGIYNNQGHEGLTLSADGNTLIGATENGLAQDGKKATLEAGSPSRFIVLDAKTLTPTAEYLYNTETIFAEAKKEPRWMDNGVSAITSMADGKLIVVERSFANGVGNMIRFYLADMSGADNILGKEKVTPSEVKAIEKTLWFSINEGDFGLDIDNIESIAFGRDIDGKHSFVIASDDNFNPANQFTQFAVFTVSLK